MPTDPISYFVDSTANVNAINKSNDTVAKTDDASAAADLNFETFLKLLVTELENQDPLDPLDNKDMTAQLAQFSSLEQNIQQNEHLEKIAGESDYSQQAVALSYIGKDALIPGDVTATDGTTQVSINYEIDDVVAKADVEIMNSDGEVVRNIEGDIFYGRNEMIWDSTDNDGNAVESGVYTFRVTGVAPDGEDVKIKEYNYGHINSLEGEGDEINFTSTDGRMFKLDDILLVRESAVGA